MFHKSGNGRQRLSAPLGKGRCSYTEYEECLSWPEAGKCPLICYLTLIAIPTIWKISLFFDGKLFPCIVTSYEPLVV